MATLVLKPIDIHLLIQRQNRA